jgi:hypothetical protein
MSATLVSATQCWVLVYKDGDEDPHFATRDAAAKEAAANALGTGRPPVEPVPAGVHCWTATCDGCGESAELDDPTHWPGTEAEMDLASLGDLLERHDDGRLLCQDCLWPARWAAEDDVDDEALPAEVAS